KDRGTMRSWHRVPARWSVSCWKIRAGQPTCPSSLSRSRPPASSSVPCRRTRRGRGTMACQPSTDRQPPHAQTRCVPSGSTVGSRIALSGTGVRSSAAVTSPTSCSASGSISGQRAPAPGSALRSSITNRASGNPTCGAASPTPGAPRIVTVIASTNSRSRSSSRRPRAERVVGRRAGWPACTSRSGRLGPSRRSRIFRVSSAMSTPRVSLVSLPPGARGHTRGPRPEPDESCATLREPVQGRTSPARAHETGDRHSTTDRPARTCRRTEHTMATVTFDDASRIYPGQERAAVDSLDIEIGDGEFLVLVGPSGCGKSTSLRMLAGLEEIDAGRILIGDRDVTDVPPKDRDIAMVFQNYALYPHMSVADNMGFALKIAGRPKAEIRKRVEDAAEILDLSEYLDRKPKALSGGQRQRVAMGRAIVRSPQVFLMDEPLSNLDAKLRVATRTQIASLQRRLGVTTVYVTHDQTEAMTMGDRV